MKTVKTAWKLFTGDMRRMFSNVVSVIIVIGLVVIPGLFTWFNVAAAWDPFGNLNQLKIAVANTDKGYKSSLVPVKVTVGDSVVNALRANNQLDWTITTKDDAIDGAKSGKYYAAVVIPSSFSKDMMTFFSDDVQHAKLTYYTNEKINAVAPKITGQGADQVAAQVNQTFAQTIATVALSVASDLSDELGSEKASKLLTTFNANVGDMATQLGDAASMLNTFAGLTDTAQSLISSSDQLVDSISASAKSASSSLKDTKQGTSDITSALNTASKALTTAFTNSSSSYQAVADSIDSTLDSAGTGASDASAGLKRQACIIDQQITEFQALRDSIAGITVPDMSDAAAHDRLVTARDNIVKQLDTAISAQTRVRNAINTAATAIDTGKTDAEAKRAEISGLAQQAKQSISGLKTSYTKEIKPQITSISNSISSVTSTLASGSDTLDSTLSDLDSTSKTAGKALSNMRSVLTSTAQLLEKNSTKLDDLNSKLAQALNSGDMSEVRSVLGNNPETLAASLEAPVKLNRKALFPVETFGTGLTPFYTFLPLWVGALLMAVTLKTQVSARIRKELGDPKPRVLFFGHYGVFAVLGLLQSTFSCGGTLLFLRVHAVHPLLFMLSGWLSSLVYSFFMYAMVVSFYNVGKAIGVIMLAMQISGSGGGYPLQVLPDFITWISPFLPATHSIMAMRAAIAGIYNNDYWIAMGKLALFIIPALLVGLVIRKPVMRFNRWYAHTLEATNVIQ